MENNLNGCNYIALASSLSIFISEQFDTDTLNLLSAFFSALGDNLGIIASTK